MTLTLLEDKIERLRDDASNTQRRLAARMKEIDADTSLSESGKTGLRDHARREAKERLSSLRSQENSLIDDEITTLRVRIESRAGSSSSDIIAFRDAQDRADRLEKAADALPMLERAIRQRDTSLASAIFRRAIDSGWAAVVRVYTDAHPESADLAQDLNTLIHAKENSLARTMHYATYGA